jgi:hypothetical protein
MTNRLATLASHLDDNGLHHLSDQIDLLGLEITPALEDIPEIAVLVAEARHDIQAMTRTAQVLPQPLEEEEEEDLCEDCGNPSDECACYHCEECGEKQEDCECSHCEKCDELISQCHCYRCSECNELEQDCECKRCSECGKLLGDCECERCSQCNQFEEVCECEKCPDCDHIPDECTCDFKDPTYLGRLRRAMILGLNIFSKVSPAYGPIADAMAHYLGGKGGERRLNVSMMSEPMRRHMIAKALVETDWIDRLNAGDTTPTSMLWDYQDYTTILPQHVQDTFDKENALATEPLQYIAGGFTYQLQPRRLRDGQVAIDVHLEDVYDFMNKKGETTTSYDIASLSSNQRILDIATNLAKRFVGDLISFSGGKINIEDRFFSALAEEGLARPFTTVIDGTLTVIQPTRQPLGDLLATQTIDDFSQFGDDIDDVGADAMMRLRPGDVRNLDIYNLVASRKLALPTIARIIQMRNSPLDRDAIMAISYRKDAQDAIDALLPIFARTDPDGTMLLVSQLAGQRIPNGDPTNISNIVKNTVAKFPQLDPRIQPRIPGLDTPMTEPIKKQVTQPTQQEPEQPRLPLEEIQACSRRLVRLAQALDDQQQPQLADQIDDVVEWVGRQYISGRNTIDLASELGKGPFWANRPLQRFWARYPELESQHAPRGLSIDWELVKQIGEAAELGFTFSETRELLGIDLSQSSMANYYNFFRERFPEKSILGKPTPITLRRTTPMTSEQAENLADVVGEMKIERGLTFREISEQLGISLPNAKTLFIRKYIPRHPEHAPQPRTDRTDMAIKMLDMYEQGTPVRNIGEMFGMSISSVWHIMMRSLPDDMLGRYIAVIRRSDPAGFESMLEATKTVIKMRLEHESVGNIAKTMGLSEGTIQNYTRLAMSMDPSLAQKIKDATVVKKRTIPHERRMG